MINFQYQLLRYRPDQVTGEFVNVGLVLFEQANNFMMARSVSTTTRAKVLFPNLKGTALQSKLKQFAQHIMQVHEQRSQELDLNPITDITQVSYATLPQDDSALYWSEVKTGRDLNLVSAFEDLFQRFIGYHLKENTPKTSDAAVWRDAYKGYFDRPEIKDMLTHHTVRTDDNNVFTFDHAVKNGVWHLMEPVAFDLINEDRIKDKVFKWVGKVAELEKSEEDFKLYLLTRMPKNGEIGSFVRDRLQQQLSDGREVEVVVPQEAEQLIQKLIQAVDGLE